MYQRRRRSTRVVPIRVEPTHQVDICDYKKTYKTGWVGTKRHCTAKENQDGTFNVYIISTNETRRNVPACFVHKKPGNTLRSWKALPGKLNTNKRRKMKHHASKGNASC